MEKEVYYLGLHLANKINCQQKKELLQHYSIIDLFKKQKYLLSKKAINSSDLIQNPNQLLDRAFSEWEKTKLLGVKITHIHLDNYPKNLLAIPDSPIVLYYKGELLDSDFNSIGIVGSRNPSKYGLNNSYQLAKVLVNHKINIVSGLAKGIDREAHRGALENGGRTIAVLGCGIDQFFPKENRLLQLKIAKTGCLLSEFPIGFPPKSYHFPIRNRIISGLSVGLVIVECGANSGAFHTAKFALDYGRELYAFPGPAGSYHHAGTHKMIKQGAKLIENGNDLLSDLSEVLEFTCHKKHSSNLSSNSDLYDLSSLVDSGSQTDSDKSIKSKEIVINNLISMEDFSENERIIYYHLSERDLKTADQLVSDSGLSVELVMKALSGLILKNNCNQVANYYSKIQKSGVI